MKPSSPTPSTPANGKNGSDEYRNIQAQWAKAKAFAEKEAIASERARVGANNDVAKSKLKKGAASEEELLKIVKEKDRKRNKAKETEFKMQHAGIVGVLVWFL